MGTRGTTTVIVGGETKVSQYGQWDHYPEGQGLVALRFLRDSGKLDALRRNAELARPALQKDFDEVADPANKQPMWPWGDLFTDEVKAAKKAWFEKFGWATRDTGAEILELIADGHVPVVNLDLDKSWGEGFPTVNFDEGTFTFEYHGESNTWSLDALPTDEEFLDSYSDV